MAKLDIPIDYFMDMYTRMRRLYVEGERISDEELSELKKMVTCECGKKECDEIRDGTLTFIHGVLETCHPGPYLSLKEMRRSIEHGGGYYDREKKKMVFHYHK